MSSKPRTDIEALRAKLSPEERARLAERLGRKTSRPTSPRAAPAAPSTARPLSHAQERLWLVEQIHPGTSAFHLPACARLTGTIDVAALDAAVRTIVARHEPLRTTFEIEAGQPVQRVDRGEAAPIDVVDLRGVIDTGEREAELERRIDEAARRPFSLATGPLFRAVVFRLRDDDAALLLAMHHIVSDAWSLGVFLREAFALYDAFLHGRPSSLAPLALSYADFSAWQRSPAESARIAGQLARFLSRFDGAPPVLELPVDHARPASPRFRGRRVERLVARPLADAARAAAHRAGATLFMVLLAAFEVVLAKATGQRDFLIGSPVANRLRPGLDTLIGFFVNTLVLRARVDPEATVAELVDGVRETALDAYAHQDVPFEQLVEALVPDRVGGHAPLVQVLFALQNVPIPVVELSDVALRPVDVDVSGAQVDLTLVAHEREGGVRFALTYDADLFDPATAERLLEHLEVVLEAMVRRPDARVGRLPILGVKEREQLLVAWSGVGADVDPAFVHELIAAQAARDPSAVAVVYEDEAVTYADLVARTRRVAADLRALGVGPEDVVPVCLDRSTAMVVALLGVLEAGAAFAPIATEYPDERLAFIARDVGARVALASRTVAPRLASVVEHVVVVGDGSSAPPRDAARPSRRPVHASNAAYVVYTSGSTGAAKGIVVDHAGFRDQVAWRRCAIDMRPGDRMLHTIPFTFDPAIWGFLGPLAAGATVVVTRPDGHRDPDYLVAAIRRHRATIVDFALPTLQSVLERARLDDVRTVRHVFCGGDAMPSELVTRYFDVFRAELFNQYGPTETVIDATFHACRPGAQRSAVPIGRPTANKRAYVLDAERELAPIGALGELFVGGAHLARGYVGQPALTAERFVPDPFATTPGARMYATGDLARWTESGELTFAGRIDRQVKIRGMRVELGEIEAVLRRHPGIDDAVVESRANAVATRELVAYVVTRGEAPRPGELAELAAESLPPYMVPAAFVRLAKLPINTNGKIDRAALPPPTAVDRDLQQAYVAPRAGDEEAVAAIWAEILGVARVGAHDDFFALGGHSLLATRATALLRDRLGVDVPVRALFEAPSVTGLARAVVRARQTRASDDAASADAADLARPAPLSVQQRAILDRARGGAGPDELHVPLAVRLDGPLDVAALEQSVRAIVRRHDALRAVLDDDDDPRRAAHDATPRFVIRDASRRDDREADGGAESDRVEADLLREDAARSFDWRVEPAIRALLVRRSDGRHTLQLTVHRAAYDGATAAILAHELCALYAAFASGAPSPLADVGRTYADFARRQRARVASREHDADLAYWRDRLAAAPGPVDFAWALPRADGVGRDRPGASTLVARVDRAVMGRLTDLAREAHATPFMVLLAAFQAALREMIASDDFVVVTPVSGRDEAHTTEMIGRFARLLPLRARVSAELTFRALLARVRDATLEDLAHQGANVEVLDDVRGDARRGPWGARVLFNVPVVPEVRSVVAGVTITLVPPIEPSAELDLALHAESHPDQLVLRLVYGGAVDAELARMFVERLVEVLERVAIDPDRPVRSSAPASRIAAPRRERMLVIGAGLTGSLLSIYLARGGHRVVVVDRLAAPGEAIQRRPTINLTLCERGLHALRAVGLEDRVLALAVPLRGRVVHGVDGALTRQPYGNAGEAIHSVPREPLIRLLIDVARREHGVLFRFGEQLALVHPLRGQAELGSSGAATAIGLVGDRVFGADGTFSTVRTQLQKTSRFSVSQEYARLGYVELTTAIVRPSAWTREVNAVHVWPRGAYMLIGLPNSDGTFSLTLHMPFEGPVSFASLATEGAIVDLFERAFPDALAHLPRLTRDYFARPPNSLVTIRCHPWAVQDRLALVGDAAHAIVPYFGQGANAGFEDCYVLWECMQEHGNDWYAVFDAYQRRRQPDTNAIADLAIRHADELGDSLGDPLFLRRKALERRLEQRFPDRFRAIYSRIAFTLAPYAEALRADEAQRGVVDLALAELERAGAADTEPALDSAIDRALGSRHEQSRTSK